MPIRVTAQRDVIQRCAGGGISNPQGLPVTFYLENVNDDTTGDDFCRPGQRVFARQIDIEYGQGQPDRQQRRRALDLRLQDREHGGDPLHGQERRVRSKSWAATATRPTAPPPDRQNPLLRNDGGRVSATLFTNLGGPFVNAVVETRGGDDDDRPEHRLSPARLRLPHRLRHPAVRRRFTLRVSVKASPSERTILGAYSMTAST